MAAVIPLRGSVLPGAGAEELTLEARRTPELVFGFVGPIGSGVTHAATLALSKMTGTFGYKGVILKISDIIAEDAIKVSEPSTFAPGLPRIEGLQTAGTRLRSKFGADYLARRAIEKINENRAAASDEEGEAQRKKAHAEPRRYVTIIDALKRPEEVALLRRVYGDLFFLFCTFAPEKTRAKRLGGSVYKTSEIDKVFEIDENDGATFGQKVRDTAHIADFFIRNDRDNDEELASTLDRYLEIIFGTKVHTPTVDETAMYAATAAARGSACLSRQVGAVIYSAAGEQIGEGCNDVPKAGGGLYGAEDATDDHRCFKWGGKKCHNDDQKSKRYDQIVTALIDAKIVTAERREEALGKVSSTSLRDLIEFSRAVHAEMEAIISVARNGNAGLPGSTLFCTTFPCHNCARHIIASGIRRVVYVEPYAKSLASTLHDDAIRFADGEGSGVIFQQYQGVAPRNIDRLFSVRGERKRAGKLFEIPPGQAEPAVAGPLDGIGIRETLVINQTSLRELAAGEKVDGQAGNGGIPA